MDYALINAGQVVNRIVADEAFVAAIAADYEHIEPLAEGSPVGVGWGWQAELGCQPPAHLAAEASPEPAPVPRHLAVGAFFDRFGPAKWAILADPSPAVQALVKDCSVRSFIDLDRADLPTALALLVQAGHAVDVEKILGAPVQAGERP
ncbi:hypothetical protein [Curvibacter lanceolatus]|uniref:hypothetical protein n=1 Tax=Curvibacter lanceolatus TaxID=86182 RepID=UPI000370CDEA|nr:hypothetical protein [Curvibacter lanceolatus]